MKEENLSAQWALRRRKNRQMKEMGYKFNGKTRM